MSRFLRNSRGHRTCTVTKSRENFEQIRALFLEMLYSYLVGCCPISDLFGKGETILGKADPSIGSPLPNKSDIGQAADQTTVLLFQPRMLILLIRRVNYFKS